MRPKSIVRFEITYWLWVAANLFSVVVDWSRTSTRPDIAQVLDRMPWFPYVVVGISVALLILLGFAIARRASNVARWIYIIIAGISVALVVPGLASGGLPSLPVEWLTVAAAVLALVAAVFLLLPDARAWFAYAADDVLPSE